MPSTGPRTYPFTPRSGVTLIAGEFWAIPLSDGSYACGRVIQPGPGRGDPPLRMAFLAGLLDWHGRDLPRADSIANAACLRQGQAHVKTILESGGVILGHRPLELDALSPWDFRGAEGHVNSSVMRGLKELRPQTPADQALPVFSTWGYVVPRVVAEARWVR